MALNKHGYEMHGLKRATRLTKGLRSGWYASIYYNIATGDVDVVQNCVDGTELPTGEWNDVRLILVDHTFTSLTMQNIADSIANALVILEKD